MQTDKRHAHTHADTQEYRRTDRQTGRQTNEHAYKLSIRSLSMAQELCLKHFASVGFIGIMHICKKQAFDVCVSAHKQTQMQKDRHGNSNRHAETHNYLKTDTIHMLTCRHTGRRWDRQAHRHANLQTQRHAEKWADRHIDKQTY